MNYSNNAYKKAIIAGRITSTGSNSPGTVSILGIELTGRCCCCKGPCCDFRYVEHAMC